jgi:hypothetical protein
MKIRIGCIIKISNEKLFLQEIRTRMNAEESIIDRIENKGLSWFGHVLGMEEERWPKRLYQWKPPGKRK